MNWMKDAACRPGSGVDPEMFFDPQRKDEARQVCAGCPVAHHCDSYAMRLTRVETQPIYGVWGGRTQNERLGKREPLPPGRPRTRAPRAPQEPGPAKVVHGTLTGVRAHWDAKEGMCPSCAAFRNRQRSRRLRRVG